ncbi:hypothetical protein THAOC_02434 [Thalassiosira oceanica]|uniref:Uncharacterized protein n=1 Tax=Thalassiosira oceanica TaxID=159749 RepID=K0TM30_THAOC|nr:hypothetical protein THAOC_02434 [Thalassiosira oceanica]|eukprot:EJK75836.1 hypothetical protein THAOC_02434 [Thalassiosira oceanica]
MTGNPSDRAAVARVLDTAPVTCPAGVAPSSGRGTLVEAGDGCAVVKIEKIYSPSFVIPGYKRTGATKDGVPLKDLSCSNIVVPLAFLRGHNKFYNCAPSQNNITRPAPNADPPVGNEDPAEQAAEQVRQAAEQVSELADNGKSVVSDERSDPLDNDNEQDDLTDWNTYVANEFDDLMSGLDSKSIKLLQAAIFSTDEALEGRDPLRCPELGRCLTPDEITNRYSSVLGDIYHAMSRTRVPIKHEAKKAYFAALKNAFLIWNPEKLEKLKSKLREEGKTDNEIEAMMYYNSRLFQDCVERHAPAPKILYYRVRAVYKLFGNIKDSFTGKPLFNKEAWKKANNILEEILLGFYSDPPGFNFYNTRLDNGVPMTNKYGMVLIDCWRGTNRTEGYHKNLKVSFGGWHMGAEASGVTLDTRNHRHNTAVSIKRRPDYPKTGHFNGWVTEQLQNLYFENHGTVLYPGFRNTSDYISTHESFGTIALQVRCFTYLCFCLKLDLSLDISIKSEALHNAVLERCKELGGDFNLTRDQQYLASAVGSPLPYLPFACKEENQKFAEMILSAESPLDDAKAAMVWTKFVDGVNIMPNFDSHIRSHRVKFDRNQRVRQCVDNMKSGQALLDEVNDLIRPRDATTEMDVAAEVAPVDNSATPAEQSTNQVPRPPQIGLSHTWTQVRPAQSLPAPSLEGLSHNSFHSVGNQAVGNNFSQSLLGHGKHCLRCLQFDSASTSGSCKGRGGVQYCDNYDEDGTRRVAPKRKKRSCKNCVAHGDDVSAETCPGRGGASYCAHHPIDHLTPKSRPKRTKPN